MSTSKEWLAASDELAARATKMIGQLGNWTMAANAGGIAFVLTTAREMAAPSSLPLATAYGSFLMGLVVGFLGHLLLALATFETAKSAAIAAGRNEAREESQEEPVNAQLSVGLDFLGGMGTVCYMLAAASAIFGLAYPLANNLL